MGAVDRGKTELDEPIMEPVATGVPTPCTERVEPRLARLAAGIGLLVFCVGTYGLVSWVATLPMLTTFGLMSEPLNPRTGFVFLLVGSAIFCQLKFSSSPTARYYVLVALVVAIALCLFCSLASVQTPQHNLASPIQHTAELLACNSFTAMSKISGLSLMLACGLLAARTLHPESRINPVAGSLALVIVLVNFVELLGNLYGLPQVWGEKIPVPRNALASAGVIGVGLSLLFASDPSSLPLRGFVGTSPKARLIRLLVPGTFLCTVGLQLAFDLLSGWKIPNPAQQNLFRALFVTGITGLVIRITSKSIGQTLPRTANDGAETSKLPIATTDWVYQTRASDSSTQQQLPTRASGQAAVPVSNAADNQAVFGALEAIFPVLVMIYRQGKCVYANKAAELILGRTKDELRNCHAWDLVQPDMRDVVRDRILRREAGEEMPFRREYPVVAGNGQIRWVDLAATRIEFDGQPAVLVCGLDVTQRKQIEEKLRAQEEQFRQVVEHIREVFWLRDHPSKNFIYVSPAYETIWGCSCKSLYESPKTWFEAILPEDRVRVQKAFAILKALGTYHETYRIERPDGAIRWIEERAFPVLNERGAVYRIAGIAEDITERKRTEAALKESETTFKTIFAKASEGMLVLDWEKRALLMCNPACSKLLGYKLKDFSKLDIAQLLHPEDFRLFSDQLAKFIKGGRWQPRDVRFVRKDKSVIFADISPAAITLAGKKAVLISFKDITKRKQMEEALRASEEQFRTLFESAPIGVALLAPDGAYIQVNRAYCSMLNYTADTLQKLKLYDVVHPDDVTIGRQLVAELATANSVHSEREIRCRTSDGRTLNVLLAASAIRNADGHLHYIVSTAMDITEAKRLQTEILEISEQERSRIGHDLHDGLGQYLSGIALKAKCLHETLSDVLPSEAQAAAELVRLIKTANAIARAVAKGLDPGDIEADNLVPALRRLATDCEQILPVQCKCMLPTEPLHLDNGKAKHLYMIVQEAITNAVKHGKARNVNLELAAQNGSLRLVIRDDGIGFDPGCNPDAGLGLRIMKYRARSIGGSINMRSQPGKGTEIECVLPLAHSSERHSTDQTDSP